MHSRRWWHLAFSAALVCCAGQAAFGAFTLTANSTDDEIKAYVEKSARQIEEACASSKPGAPRDALVVRTDLLDQFDPARKLPSNVTFSYSKALDDAFRKMIGPGKPANLALNAAVIVCNPRMDPLSNDQTLGDALQNTANPGVRYWAAKGLVSSMPVLATTLPTAVTGPRGLMIKIDTALKTETSSVVTAELHEALSETAIAATGPIQTNAVDILTKSMAKTAKAWIKGNPSPEQVFMATTSLDAIAKLEDPSNKVLLDPSQKIDALSAACGFMSYSVQWAAKRGDATESITPAIYRLVESGRQAIARLNGFGVPSIKNNESVGTAELTINGAVGSSAPAPDFSKNFPGVTQPTDITEAPEEVGPATSGSTTQPPKPKTVSNNSQE